MNALYVRLELTRLVRNRQNFIFSLIFPVILYLFVAGSQRHTQLDGISFPTYYLAAMVAFGGMGAAVGGGARIAFERETGWTRQLRISPLTSRAYLQIKVLTSYLMCVITIAALYVAGISYGVRMPALRWLEMTALILIGLIPFVALGVMIGHLIRGDSMGAVMGFGTTMLSFAGGAFGPLGGHGSVLRRISEFVPSYWIVQAGHTAVGAGPWGVKGWVIVAAWSALAIYGAAWAHRRDTGRA